MTDQAWQNLIAGCESCARCGTPIMPHQRDTAAMEMVLRDAQLTARIGMETEHENREDCIDGLLRRVNGRPPWSGIEDRILGALGRRPWLRDLDCITGRVEKP